MKRSELFFGALLVPIDFIMLLAAGLSAYWLRTSALVQAWRPAVFEVDLSLIEYLQLSILAAILVIVIFAAQGLYMIQVTRRPIEELTKIFTSVSLGAMSVIVYMFLSAELFQSRFILLAAYVLGVIYVALGRWLVRSIQIEMSRRGFGVHRVVLVGNGRYGEVLNEIFWSQPELGYRVVGDVDEVRWDALEKIQNTIGIDEMIQTNPGLQTRDYLILLDFCDKHKIEFKYVPNLFETYAVNVRYRQIEGVPVVELLRTPLDGWGRVAKRIMDIVGSLIGILVLFPILIGTAIAIKLESSGPIMFKQERVGKNKRIFEMYKFRSMYAKYCTGAKYGGKAAEMFKEKLKQEQNERSGPLFKMKKDPRITKVGIFIRKWRIDELPQFINVLKGEMSLLGPRPHLQSEVDKYGKHHQSLFTIKPGMSGMAQVNGNAGLSFNQEAKLDIGYIEQWSLQLDIILLIKTFFILLRDKNAV